MPQADVSILWWTANAGLMPAIEQGQTFDNLLDFKKALREWAIERNFTPHILDSDSHRVRAGCRTGPDCPFRIRANYNEKRALAKVTTCDDIHTCVSTSELLVSQNIKRPEAGKLKFLIDAVPKLIDVDGKTTTSTIIEAVEGRYGQKISLRQAQKVKRALVRKSKGPCRQCHRIGHGRRNCPHGHVSTSDAAVPLNDDLPNDLMEYANEMIEVESTEDERPRKATHCGVCFQTGHNRKNCPQKPNAVASDAAINAVPEDYPRQAAAALMRDGNNNVVVVDPTLMNGARRVATVLLPANSLPPISLPPTSRPPTATPQSSLSSVPCHPPAPGIVQPPTIETEPQPRTPQATRLEASKLMQQAAKLMNEAARLNSEAARLTASVANS